MNKQDAKELIDNLLNKVNKKYKDKHEQILYERGYLTGILAYLMTTDYNVVKEIKQRIEATKK